MEIIHTNSHTEASRLRDKGYCPVECSFGTHGSVVDSLVMDHHGEYSHTTGVAVRAYKEHFGARKDDQRFVVTGAADGDATFAIAALAGLLPHPGRTDELADAPPPVRTALTRDLTVLAELVNLVDTAPIGVRLEETEEGRLLLLWNQLSSGSSDATAFHAGVDRWRMLTGTRPPKTLLNAAASEEAERVATARSAKVLEHNGTVAVVESPCWGFDVWYAELSPIVIAFVASQGNITIGVRDAETAERLLGPGGLKNIFPKLGEGWGGREAIGGSPRGQTMTRAHALEAAQVILTASV